MVNHIRFIDARDKEAPTLSTTTSYVFFKAQHWLIVRSSRISHSWGNVSLQTAVYLKANNPFFTTWKSKSTSACSATLAKLLIDQKLVFVLLRILIGQHFLQKGKGEWFNWLTYLFGQLDCGSTIVNANNLKKCWQKCNKKYDYHCLCNRYNQPSL